MEDGNDAGAQRHLAALLEDPSHPADPSQAECDGFITKHQLFSKEGLRLVAGAIETTGETTRSFSRRIAHRIEELLGAWQRARDAIGLLDRAVTHNSVAEARQRLGAAQEVLNRNHYPVPWAHLEAVRGKAILVDERGSRYDNLRAARICYENALEVLTRARSPAEWAELTTRLGTLYFDMCPTTPADPWPAEGLVSTLRRSLRCFEDVLALPEKDSWVFRAKCSAWIALGRVFGNPRPHMIAAAAEAEMCPQDSAEPEVTEREYLDRALECYDKALELCRDDTTTAEITTYIGDTLTRRSLVGNTSAGEPSLRLAIECLEISLELSARSGQYFNAAQSSRLLARAWYAWYSLLNADAEVASAEERGAMREAALSYYRQARSLYATFGSTVGDAETLVEMGARAFEEHDYHAAVEQYVQALERMEELGYQRGNRQDVSSLFQTDWVDECIVALVRLGRSWDALLLVDKGRALDILARRSGWRTFPVAGTDAEFLRGVWDWVERLRLGEITEETYLTRCGENPAAIERLMTADLDAELTAREVRAVVDGMKATVVVVRMTARFGTLAFVIGTTPGGATEAVECIEIPGFGRSEMWRIVHGDGGGSDGWEKAYLRWRGTSGEPESTAADEHRRSWFGIVEAGLEKVQKGIWEAILAAIRCRGDVPRRVIVVAGSLLNLIPLHACSWSEEERRRYVCDEYTVSYAPSLKVLAEVLQGGSACAGGWLGIANTRRDLPGSEWENDRIAAGLKSIGVSGVETIRRSEATRGRIREKARGKGVVHFACHGSHDMEKPWQSCLEVADGVITAVDLANRGVCLSGACVVTSSCETALVPSSAPWGDGYLGLPAGLLAGGARAVVGSLWSVDVITANLLMVEMYRQWAKGSDLADALRGAQLWLRDLSREEAGAAVDRMHDEIYAEAALEVRVEREVRSLAKELLNKERGAPPFAHPYYWAGFLLYGDPSVRLTQVP